jgi:prolyl-tRNA editing enzyme YbaK/EbsC (Cys-tRNA(Pro) deacylase)
MLSSSDLAGFIARNQINAELIQLEVETPTVQSAARALGTSQDHILKSVLFLVQDHPVLAIGLGPARIDRRPIAEHFGVGKKKVLLADPNMVIEITGYPVGTLPPFGHRSKLETLLEIQTIHMEKLYAGGGAIDTMMLVSTDDLMRVTQAYVLSLQDHYPLSGTASSPSQVRS